MKYPMMTAVATEFRVIINKFVFWVYKKLMFLKNKKEYTDVKSFFQDMISDYYVVNYSFNLESNQYIYAWLEINGFEKEVSKYYALLSSVEQLEGKGWKK